ncbi:capsid cement protein [Piscirickettsia salmonis]|uniref:capsid cement protein n=1 Tax=Piscirickettsia salmonis TaxID=1238 RepID=UPI003EBBD8C7
MFLQGYGIGVLPAATDLSAKQLAAVSYTATGFDLSSAGGLCDGVLQNKPEQGAVCDVMQTGIAKMVASAAITAGNYVKIAANSQVAQATAGDTAIGKAVESAGASGDIIGVILIPNGYVIPALPQPSPNLFGVAAADLSGSQNAAVSITKDGFTVTAAGKACDGILQNTPKKGEACEVICSGAVKSTAAGAITAGDYVKVASNGQIIQAAAGDTATAMALETAKAAGDLIGINLIPNGYAIPNPS